MPTSRLKPTGIYSKDRPALVPKHDTSNSQSRVIDKDSAGYYNASLKNNLATIRVIPLTDAASTGKYLNYEINNAKQVFNYIGFVLTSVSESHEEKVSIMSLPGDSYAAFFYGTQPRTLSLSGIVFNTESDNWRDSFSILYEDYIRGTSAARLNSIVQIKYEDRIVSGHITNMAQTLDAQNPVAVQFQMTMVVRSVTLLSVTNRDDLLISNSYPENLNDALASSNIKLLSEDKLKYLRSYVRTSTIAPPPKPPVPKAGIKLQQAKNCYITSNGDVKSGSLVDLQCTAADIVQYQLARRVEAQAAQQELLRQASLKPDKRVDQGALQRAKDQETEAEAALTELLNTETEQGKALKKKLDEDIALTKEVAKSNRVTGEVTAQIGQTGVKITLDANGNDTTFKGQNPGEILLKQIQQANTSLSDASLSANSTKLKAEEEAQDQARAAREKALKQSRIVIEKSNQRKATARLFQTP